jgi:hypothetical protein
MTRPKETTVPLTPAQLANLVTEHRLPFILGASEWRSGFGRTFDGDPESPRSEAYDLGRTIGEALDLPAPVEPEFGFDYGGNMGNRYLTDADVTVDGFIIGTITVDHDGLIEWHAWSRMEDPDGVAYAPPAPLGNLTTLRAHYAAEG